MRLNHGCVKAAVSIVPCPSEASVWPVGCGFGVWENDQKSWTDHEFHGEEAVAASPQAGVCQQAVNAIGDAPVELQLPLHNLALSVIQEKGALREGMGRVV